MLARQRPKLSYACVAVWWKTTNIELYVWSTSCTFGAKVTWYGPLRINSVMSTHSNSLDGPRLSFKPIERYGLFARKPVRGLFFFQCSRPQTTMMTSNPNDCLFSRSFYSWSQAEIIASCFRKASVRPLCPKTRFGSGKNKRMTSTPQTIAN